MGLLKSYDRRTRGARQLRTLTAYLSCVGKDVKIKADLFRGTGRRDKESEVPTLPRNCVVEKSKCKNRMHKTQTLWSRMVEFYALEKDWAYNKIWCTAME